MKITISWNCEDSVMFFFSFNFLIYANENFIILSIFTFKNQ